MNYKQQLSRFYKGELGRYEAFSFGLPPQILVKHGMPNLEIIMTQSTARKSTRSDAKKRTGHNISRQIMKDLKNQINNPMIVIKNTEKNAFILVTDKKDSEGRPVVVVIHNSQAYNSRKINEIVSIYGRKDFVLYLQRQKENIVFEDKKRVGI
jgi:hypothetical protein